MANEWRATTHKSELMIIASIYNANINHKELSNSYAHFPIPIVNDIIRFSFNSAITRGEGGSVGG